MKNINLYEKYRLDSSEITLDYLTLVFHKTIFLNRLGHILQKNL